MTNPVTVEFRLFLTHDAQLQRYSTRWLIHHAQYHVTMEIAGTETDQFTSNLAQTSRWRRVDALLLKTLTEN